MRIHLPLRAATLAAIAAGLVIAACTAQPSVSISSTIADGGSGCVNTLCPGGPLATSALSGGWSSIGYTSLPGGYVRLGPGPVGGPLGTDPSQAHDGLTPEMQAEFVPVLVEALRTPYDADNPRVNSIAGGLYGGVSRPGIEDLFAPMPLGGWEYPDDLYSTPVTVKSVKITGAFPQAQTTLTANLPLVSEDGSKHGVMSVERTVQVTLMNGCVLDWSRSEDTLGHVQYVKTPPTSPIQFPGSGSGSIGNTTA